VAESKIFHVHGVGDWRPSAQLKSKMFLSFHLTSVDATLICDEVLASAKAQYVGIGFSGTYSSLNMVFMPLQVRMFRKSLGIDP
jgi:hypothetical protein